MAVCRRLLDPSRYGRTRLGAVRLIAGAAPTGASRGDVYAYFREISPEKDPGRMMGALHQNLEATWRRLRGPGVFFHTTPTGFAMEPEVAAAVLEVLDTQSPEDAAR